MRFVLAITLVLVLALALSGFAAANLSSKTPDVSNGPCVFPRELAIDTNLFTLFKVNQWLYFPRASKGEYRYFYERLHGGRSASTEEELITIQPRQKFTLLPGVLDGAAANARTIFYGDEKLGLNHMCLPTKLWTRPLHAITLNVTCTEVSRSPGVTEPDPALVTFNSAAVWSDLTATVLWICENGLQRFVIVSTTPELTPEQIEKSEAALASLRFDPSKAMNIKYEQTQA